MSVQNKYIGKSKMSRARLFTINDVREINQRMIDKRPIDVSRLSTVSQRVIRDTKFSTAEINAAYANARKSLAKI